MEYLSPLGSACGTADLKTYCEDFRVTEIGKFTPCGEGEHVWLWVEKENANTAWLAEELAKQSGIKLRDVSYAGRKDKVAITQQWFSLYDPKRISDDVQYAIPNCKVLKTLRHTQKLRAGNLLGNHFDIRLRNFHGDFELLQQRIERIEQQGFANYFGPQRFGRHMSNLPKAIAWVEKGAGRLRREQRSLYFSVLRSYLFNLVLSERIRQDSWNKILLGELAQLHGNKSVFVVGSDELEDAQERCASFDISPTGPLLGSGNVAPQETALSIEQSIFQQHPIVANFLLKEANSARRSLRIRPESLSIQQDDMDILLNFSLPAGCYATVFLKNLLEIYDKSVN